MITWLVNKVRIISLGSLQVLCANLYGHTWKWTSRIDHDFCYIRFNNPDEYGKNRYCTFRFPIVGSLGNNDLEKLILLDGVVAEQIECSNYEYIDEDSGNPYSDTDESFDWAAAMDPIFVAFDKAMNYKMSLNPSL
jgi:hypothetical protein